MTWFTWHGWRCEWDPYTKAPLKVGDVAHAKAAYRIGYGKGSWMLCASCANLPQFVNSAPRLKIRKPLR